MTLHDCTLGRDRQTYNEKLSNLKPKIKMTRTKVCGFYMHEKAIA